VTKPLNMWGMPKVEGRGHRENRDPEGDIRRRAEQIAGAWLSTSCREDVENLNGLLAGKMVASVECVASSESIAKFNMADGTSFTLFGNELGIWIEQEES
jgi:hypothetical protein